MRATKYYVAVLVAVLVAGGLVSYAIADHHEKKAGEYSEAEMKAWMEATSPGEHHSYFDMLEGKWMAKMTRWDAPGAEPMVIEGTSEYKKVLGGRFVEQHMEMTMMGMPFEGIGMAGFNKQAGKHTSIWCDNMSTAMTYSDGTCKDGCKVVTHKFEHTTPFGETMNVKYVTTVKSENEHLFEWYVLSDDGKEFKQLEIIYTR